MSVTLDQAMERARGAADALIAGQLDQLRQDMEMAGAQDDAIAAEVQHWRAILAEHRDAQLAELRSFIIRDGSTLQ